MRTSKNTTTSDNSKWKRPSSSSEVVYEKVKILRISSIKMKNKNTYDEFCGGDDDTSDGDSKPLVSFLKKLKGKKEKEVGERQFRK